MRRNIVQFAAVGFDFAVGAQVCTRSEWSIYNHGRPVDWHLAEKASREVYDHAKSNRPLVCVSVIEEVCMLWEANNAIP